MMADTRKAFKKLSHLYIKAIAVSLLVYRRIGVWLEERFTCITVEI